MNKLLFSFVFFLSTFSLTAQETDNFQALQLLSKNSKEIGLSPEDLSNAIISNTYYNKFAGTRMVYLQQSYLGLPVYNQIQVLAFRADKLVSAAGDRIKGIGKKTMSANPMPSVTATRAVLTALAAKNIKLKTALRGIAEVTPGKIDFGKAGITTENITAELMWVPLEDGNVKLAWQVYLVPKDLPDYFLIRVDAKTNEIIGEDNLTVYCNFDNKNEHKHVTNCLEKQPDTKISVTPQSPSIVGTANYLVVPFPAESPIHPGGTPALRTNPWTLAGGNASTLGWHNDGNLDYNISRGNNVWAREDRAGTTTVDNPVLSATSTTSPDPLNFNFTPNFTVDPTQTTPVQNQQFNITNLFYWNNIVHDLTYLYGFDEVSGNFQTSNMGRGGLGNDYVNAQAQDGGSLNNANFGTPPDGQVPRMQMYLWGGTPRKDADVDNGIIVHEYAHGISNRLTGGPANSSCLQNAEQMGEGWSDYYSLMYTQDWSTSTLSTGFTSPRGIGTYVQNQPITGAGIRTQRYCTNFAINNKVFAASISSAPHTRGELWCATLWDMTWNIINQVGTINPNLFNPSAGGGNAIALKLVTEGMRLQPCSPGFITGRNAILQADQILYGGAYSCAIKEAFRRRGMGDNASQGSSGSVTDQIADFSLGTITLTQSGMTQVEEGQNIVYTNTVNSTCSPLTGHTLRDTLPSNVTYVSGGTYDPATRVVSFPVNQAAGIIQNYTFTVVVNSGSYFPTVTLIDEQVTGPTISADWTTTATPAANQWTVSSAQSQSAPNSFYTTNLAVAGDHKLETTNAVNLPAGTSPKFSFAHRFNTEEGWDGGVVEISTNNGTSWIDLGPNMTTGAYNGTLGAAPTNVLSNRSAFTGTVNSFMTTSINLTPFAGQNVKFRFRFGSDDNTSAPSGTPGWYVDNILLNLSPVVNMRAGLFNAANVRIGKADTVTLIVPGNICTVVGITTQPVNTSACTGNNATFTVVSTGTAATYQWQLSINAGTSWTDIAGATAATYTVTAVTALMDNYRYRVIVSNACPSTITSGAAILTVSSSATITSHPTDVVACPGANASFTVVASGSNLAYQWQVSTDGIIYTNIPSATSATLTLSNVTASMNDNLYRVIAFSCGPVGVNSNAARLTVTPALTISSQPSNAAACIGNNVSFTVAAAGPSLSYQWQVSIDGVTFTNIAGQTSATLNLTNVTLAQNGNQYRVVLSGTCSPLTSGAATLSINTNVAITTQPGNFSGCIGSTTSVSVTATGTSITYQWQVSINNGPFTNLTNNTNYSGVTTNTLNFPNLVSSMNGYQYRVIASGVPCGAVTSTAATLTVNQNPTVSLSTNIINLSPGSVANLSTLVTPGGSFTYQWFKNGALVNGASSSSYPVTIDALGNYSVRVTDANGCSTLSNIITIGDSVTNIVFIYPNPNTGNFQVRFYSQPNIKTDWSINMYDSRGRRVYVKSYKIQGTYDQMKVNMQNVTAGIYLLELSDAKGLRLATARVLIQ